MVHVRNASGGAVTETRPRDLLADGGTRTITAEASIARSAEGPFVPLPVALDRDGALRDRFAAEISVPSGRAWRSARIVALVLGLPPLLMILELDRELVAKELLGGARLLVDALVLAYVGFELTRRTPRLPRVAAAAFAATGLRFLLVSARSCGAGVSPLVWAAAAFALGASGVLLVHAPTRARSSLELLDKLGISRADANDVRRPPAIPGALLWPAIGATALLPLAAWQLRAQHLTSLQQGLVLVLLALAIPALLGVHARRLGTSLADPASRTASIVVPAIAAGLVLTASLLHGAHHFFDAGGELARCTHRLDEASRKLLAAEAAEVTRRIAVVRASTGLIVMNVLVMPFVEERIWRGVLLNVLVRRYGTAYGLVVSSLAFGVTHLGLYEIALYQTVLLGLAFGVAYLEGGLLAALVVHATWNLLNVA